ncbi:MAG: sulfite exporter TauE/SafE family protein [Planctomycetia bacterium]|nr:sulfite exporter TauE/SafE family protein [Planctomycetia bacterium]
MTYLLYLAIGLAVGTISGTMGIGGGVVMVPALMLLCGFDAHRATGTSLALLSLPIALPSAVRAFRHDHVDPTAVLWLAGAFMIGAYLGRSYIEYFPEAWLRFLFGMLMIYIAMRYVITAESEVAHTLAGLSAVALAWLAYGLLRALGRRHRTPPELGQTIRGAREAGRGELDYHI